MLMEDVRDASPSLEIASPSQPAIPLFEDPLDEDEAGETTTPVTRRGLMRLALVAGETAARFQREGLALDPMAWMIARRELFDGRSAIEACVERSACVRALLLHGLGLGLDADPAVVDDLAADEDDAAEDAVEADRPDRLGSDRGSPRSQRLFTSTAASEAAGGWVQLFHATVARSQEEALEHLRADHGARAAAAAETIAGFRPDLPLATALVSPAMADMLLQVQRDPASPLAAGLRVSIEQRFEA